jgi:hypothetical protein
MNKRKLGVRICKNHEQKEVFLGFIKGQETARRGETCLGQISWRLEKKGFEEKDPRGIGHRAVNVEELTKIFGTR